MPSASNEPFRTLADPTRRAIFERLSRDGELTVRALTDHSGVSQPAVSKHLALLKLAVYEVLEMRSCFLMDRQPQGDEYDDDPLYLECILTML